MRDDKVRLTLMMMCVFSAVFIMCMTVVVCRHKQEMKKLEIQQYQQEEQAHKQPSTKTKW